MLYANKMQFMKIILNWFFSQLFSVQTEINCLQQLVITAILGTVSYNVTEISPRKHNHFPSDQSANFQTNIIEDLL